MNEIIKVNTDSQTVSARDLHEALNVEKRFSAWFETNSIGFIEGEDFTSVLTSTVVNNGAVRPLTDFALSMDMAKHICLMSRTEKGKEIRQYFIDLEKAWNTPEQIMARALKVAQYTIDSLQFQIADMQPKADYFDELVDRKLNLSFRNTAKELGIKEKSLIGWLLAEHYIFRDAVTNTLRPYAKFTESGQGYFTMKEYASQRNSHAGTQTLITPKGRETFRVLLERA